MRRRHVPRPVLDERQAWLAIYGGRRISALPADTNLGAHTPATTKADAQADPGRDSRSSLAPTSTDGGASGHPFTRSKQP